MFRVAFLAGLAPGTGTTDTGWYRYYPTLAGLGCYRSFYLCRVLGSFLGPSGNVLVTIGFPEFTLPPPVLPGLQLPVLSDPCCVRCYRHCSSRYCRTLAGLGSYRILHPLSYGRQVAQGYQFFVVIMVSLLLPVSLVILFASFCWQPVLPVPYWYWWVPEFPFMSGGSGAFRMSVDCRYLPSFWWLFIATGNLLAGSVPGSTGLFKSGCYLISAFFRLLLYLQPFGKH